MNQNYWEICRPFNIATLTLGWLKKLELRTERVKPIKCGKSFHLIAQRDQKLTDKRPRKLSIFLALDWENMPTIKMYLFVLLIYKEHRIFSGKPNMFSLAIVMHVHNFDGMIHGIWLQIPFWMWSNQIMSSILHILCNIVYKFWIRYEKISYLCGNIIDIFYFNIEIFVVIVIRLKIGFLNAIISNDDHAIELLCIVNRGQRLQFS